MNSSLIKKAIVILIPLILLAAAAWAEIPPYINYQGILTDSLGVIVPNGDYDVSFSIWLDSTSTYSSDQIWTSGYQSISVKKGVFSYILGSSVPFPDEIFLSKADWFLGVTLAGESEMQPRTRLTASPFSFHSLIADSTLSFNGDQYVKAKGDTLTGDLYFNYNDAGIGGYLDLSTATSNLFLTSSSIYTTSLYGSSYGTLFLRDNTGDLTAILDATSNSGGKLSIRNSSGSELIKLTGVTTGDNSVILPDNAVNSDEIYDEPGIVSAVDYVEDGIEFNDDAMTDLQTVTITIPQPGYIYLIGRCNIMFEDTTTFQGAYVQIDQTSGGSEIEGECLYLNDWVSYYELCYYPVFVDRIYYKSAGTYTFRLEGMLEESRVGYGVAYNPSLKAMYFPTSYGTVSAIMHDPEDNPTAQAITYTNSKGASETVYEVDLRDLELKAKEARLRALEAELELEKARARSEESE